VNDWVRYMQERQSKFNDECRMRENIWELNRKLDAIENRTKEFVEKLKGQ
jgi:hypothetical protein